MAFNKIILVGNLVSDPEVKMTTQGTSVCNFSLAVNRKFAKQGEQNVDFINICTWGASADFVGRYAKKGTSLLVCGRLQTRNYNNAQGQKVYVTEVVAEEVSFAGNKSDNSNQPRVSVPQSNGNSHMPNAYGGNSAGFEPIEVASDDSLPF